MRGETFASSAPSEASGLNRYAAGDEAISKCESDCSGQSQADADAVEFCYGGLVWALVGCSGIMYAGFGLAEDKNLDVGLLRDSISGVVNYC